MENVHDLPKYEEDLKKAMMSKGNKDYKIYVEDETLVIEGQRNFDTRCDDEVHRDDITRLCTPVWNTIPGCTKVIVKYFIIENNPACEWEWDSPHCALWMMEKYGRDCLQECHVIEDGPHYQGGLSGERIGPHIVGKPVDLICSSCHELKNANDNVCKKCSQKK